MSIFILLLGAFFDAVIGINLFVHGEPFLLTAGYQLFHGSWLGVLAVAMGGLIGDQTSFFIGRKMGANAQRWLMGWQPKTKRPIARFRLLMQTQGNFLLMFARLLGPVAWVVPFLAGSQQVKWQRFSLFSSIGLVLGVGLWVFWGYLLASGIDTSLLLFPYLSGWWAELNIFLIEHQSALIILLLVLLVMLSHRLWSIPYYKTSLIMVLLGGIGWQNYSHFFEKSDNFISTSPLVSQPLHIKTNDLALLQQSLKPLSLKPLSNNNGLNDNLKTYAGQSYGYEAQGINIIFSGDSPKDLMQAMGWIENKTFSRDELEIGDYWQLLKNKTPPVSDLFWQGQPQDYAYQKAGTLSKRVHIRWWYAGIDLETGKKRWLGAISYDDGLAVTFHGGIPTLLHKVDADIDSQRDSFAQEVAQHASHLTTRLLTIGQPVVEDGLHDYFSDGRVLLIL
ncbi:LssY C-terminal domain-containing protein [Psychrobacter sp. FDAARGOS_221]|uniref:LssY C-terminal domain-containing protein n=1 Tax=Psychrobacter sp. FDAARGOS_221 TaxID=1975705 RepID=UPI00187D668C|nr:LssY C-terminal domain-containing protein [Psychrobacter sp. FDAARGOS_221]